MLRSRALGIVLILIFILLASACGGESASQETPQSKSLTTSEKPLIDHPDELYIEFSESVVERDRRLVNMAVDITRPLFASHGFPLYVEVYIAGDGKYFLDTAETVFGMSAEEANEKYVSVRGLAKGYTGKILINIPLHDALYEGEHRDGTFVFTVSHELYHILQAKLSRGWSGLSREPLWITETSANLGAFRAMAAAFCKPLDEVNQAAASFALVPECPQGFIEKSILNYNAEIFLTKPSPESGMKLYLETKFGLEAYDKYYTELSNNATTSEEEFFQIHGALWLRTLQEVYGAPSLDTLLEDAKAYIREHKEEIFKDFVKEDGKSSEK